MTDTETGVEHLLRESRPDDALPKVLKHEKIREVRDVRSYRYEAYQIAFDQSWLPYGYWNPQPEDWEIQYARTEYHQPTSGLLKRFRAPVTCICIVVSREVDDDFL